MLQELGASAAEPVVAPFSWNRVWISAITQPSVETYENLARDPNASFMKACLLMLVSGFTSGVILILMVYVLTHTTAYGGTDLSFLLWSLLCIAPIAGIQSVLGLVITTGISQATARALGGTGTFSKLAFASAAYRAPMMIATGFVSLIPLFNLLSLPLGLYGVVLNVIAVKAVNQFGWGKAIISGFLVVAGFVVAVACIVIVGLALLGPAIDSTMSSILQQTSGTPIP
jgi:hypothetical protein